MNRTILSLATLKTIWADQKNDYIDNFLSFMATLIKKRKYSEIDISQLMKDFEDEYGLIIPRNPIITILKRMVKRGFIEKKHSKLFPIKEKLLRLNFQLNQ